MSQRLIVSVYFGKGKCSVKGTEVRNKSGSFGWYFPTGGKSQKSHCLIILSMQNALDVLIIPISLLHVNSLK